MSESLNEAIAEQAAITCMERLGWTIKHGLEIGPGELAAERGDFGQRVLAQRLQDATGR